MAEDKPDNAAAKAVIKEALAELLDERDAKRQRDADDAAADAAKSKGLLGSLFG